MKKLYALSFIALAVTFSTSAVVRPLTAKTTKTKTFIETLKGTDRHHPTNVVAYSADDEGWTSLGNATLQDGWLLPEFGIDQTDPSNWYEVELQQNNENSNVYRLVDPYHGNSPVAAYNECTYVGYIQFDVTDPEHVVFSAVKAGFANSELGITEFYAYNALTTFMLWYDTSVEEIIEEYGEDFLYTTFNDGVVTLGMALGMSDACFGIQDDIEGGYTWSDQSGENLNMTTRIFFPGTDLPGDPNEGWTSLGNATIQDGWILPGFSMDPSEYQYEAELQQNDENPNLYRVVNPYKGNWPFASYNTYLDNGYIQFDVTDPAHVLFDIVPAGLNLTVAGGDSNYYCYNMLAWAVAFFQGTPENILDLYGDYISAATFENGVVLLPSEDLGPTGYSSDACYGLNNDPTGGYGWSDADQVGLNMEAKIIFPTFSVITSPEVESATAPVEYFNLQGVRINDPAAGQVVIRRKGNRVDKILTR